MSNFDPNAISRGAQLTLVGAHRALQNPNIFTSGHYRQAAIAVCAGLGIRTIVNVPIYTVKLLLLILGLFYDLQDVGWDDKLISGLDFLANSVLQIPFVLMTLMSSLTPTLDNLFMNSLHWVDQTYMVKHKTDDPTQLRAMYYENLSMYSTHGEIEKKKKRSTLEAVFIYAERYGKRAAISLTIYAVTFIPVIGRFVLPAVSCYTFNKAVGPVPAAIVLGGGMFLPKRYMITFLQTYFSSRSLMRELLQPYFLRVRFTPDQKKRWFIDRSGVLFGFSLAFAVMIKVPFLGVLIYGIAEASTAYLITKITEPPPPPMKAQQYIESEVRWKNKHKFLDLPLDRLDEFNAKMTETDEERAKRRAAETSRRQFT